MTETRAPDAEPAPQPTAVGRGAAGAADASMASIGASIGAPIRDRLRALGERLGRNVKVLIGSPGMGGHSNGAERIALRARDAGFEVVYQGICATSAQLAQSAIEEGVHLVGLSVPSGAHDELVSEVLDALRAAGATKVPVVVVGIIPEADARALEARGAARVYTPEDLALGTLMDDLAEIVRRAHGLT